MDFNFFDNLIGNIVIHTIFISLLGLYLITNLQWYSYKFERVLLKHSKPLWHVTYFGIPVIVAYFANQFFWLFLFLVYLPIMFLWYRKLDKKLVFTPRVKRFFFILISLSLFQDYLILIQIGREFSYFYPLILTIIGSFTFEKMVYLSFYFKAEKKLKDMKNIKVIAITGSYGKTSIKNFLTETLSLKYKVYATPRSVNTVEGIVRDINENLKNHIDIYIVEAGARKKGDILNIAKLVKPHISIVGKIGLQHIEYFKNISNIRDTKMELAQSERLEKLFLHKSVDINGLDISSFKNKIERYGNDIKDVSADLSGISFNFKDVNYFSHILGAFQSENLEVVIKTAFIFDFSVDEVQRRLKSLKQVEHRLQKIETGDKIILDDGYNGNIDGMLDAFKLIETYKGRKVLVTPGLVESNEELNKQIAIEADKVFDLIIVTGDLNREIFRKNLNNENKIHLFLHEKSLLKNLLSEKTTKGDIILFANDAPNFI